MIIVTLVAASAGTGHLTMTRPTGLHAQCWFCLASALQEMVQTQNMFLAVAHERTPHELVVLV